MAEATKFWTPKDPDRTFTAREAKSIAKLQSITRAYVLVYVLAFATCSLCPNLLIPLMVIAYLWPLFLFMLCLKIHGIGLSVLLTMLGMAPVAGLAIFIVVNSQANDILKRAGYRAGWFGVRPW